MKTFSLRILLIALLFSCVFIEGSSQTALPEMTMDVSLEIVDYEISEYPEFSMKITNSSPETIHLLEYDKNYNVPDFYRLILDPEYEFYSETTYEAVPKTPRFYIEIEPGKSHEFTLKLDYTIVPFHDYEGTEVDMYLTYQYDPSFDFQSALEWYSETFPKWMTAGPLRKDLKPYLAELSPLRLKSQTIRVKIPRL